MAIRRARIAFSPGVSRNSGRHGVGQRFGYSLVDFPRIPQIYGIAHMRFHARTWILDFFDAGSGSGTGGMLHEVPEERSTASAGSDNSYMALWCRPREATVGTGFNPDVTRTLVVGLRGRAPRLGKCIETGTSHTTHALFARATTATDSVVERRAELAPMPEGNDP